MYHIGIIISHLHASLKLKDLLLHIASFDFPWTLMMVPGHGSH